MTILLVMRMTLSPYPHSPQTQKNLKYLYLRFLLIQTWRCPTLTWGSPTLPSALQRFTSKFGMELGGSTALSPPRYSVDVFSCLLYSSVLPSCFLQSRTLIKNKLSKVIFSSSSSSNVSLNTQKHLSVVWLSLSGN